MASAVLAVDDLLSAIFASFDAWDGAAACVCRAWRQMWANTDDRRRGLRQVTLDPRMLTLDPVTMCSPPSGAWHGVQQRDGVVIVDASMQVRHRLAGPPYNGDINVVCLCASDELLYVSTWDPAMARIASFDATDMAPREVHETPDYDAYWSMVLAHDTLFALRSWGENKYDVVAFELTLATRFSFGTAVFQHSVQVALTSGMAVVGNELYVGDTGRRCLHVFSLDGTPLREVRGDWRAPRQMLHHNGRLYLKEWDEMDWEEFDPKNEEARAASRRIFVLTPKGQTLQVWRIPGGSRALPDHGLGSMSVVDRQLIVRGFIASGSAVWGFKGV